MALRKKAFWKKRNVLVTGGSGFLGYRLSEALSQQGARVTVLDIKPLPVFPNQKQTRNIRYVRGSVTDAKKLKKIFSDGKFKTVFHLAAEAIESRSYATPLESLDTNIRGTWEVLEMARNTGRVSEIVVASSDKAYGEHEHLPYREEFALHGMTPYACSKSCTDLIAMMYATAYALPTAIARCGNIYGGGDKNASRLIPDALAALYNNRTFRVRSDGTFMRDYVYIDDIVSAYLLLAEKLVSQNLAGSAFNFGNNNPLSVLNVLAMLDKKSIRKLTIQIDNNTHREIKNQYLDASRAKKVLGWSAATSHEKGFAQTAKWYANYFAHGGKLER